MQDETIRMAPLFMGLDDQEYQLLTDEFSTATAPADTYLFRAGNPGEALYLIKKGFVRLTTPTGQNIATLGPGSILGEDGLLRGTSNDVSAVTIADLEYGVLTDRQLRNILLQHPAVSLPDELPTPALGMPMPFEPRSRQTGDADGIESHGTGVGGGHPESVHRSLHRHQQACHDLAVPRPIIRGQEVGG